MTSCKKTGMTTPPEVRCIPTVRLNPPDHNYSKLVLTQTYRNNYADTSWQRIYSFDELKRVKSEEYKDHNFSYTNYISEFVYDENNLVIEEIRGDSVYRSICWEKDSARYYDTLDESNYNLVFDDNKLIQINSGFRTVSYEYNFEEDTVSIDVDGELRTDLLDFDEQVLNPYHLLKTIGVIQYWNSYPFLKNIHHVEKRYPFKELDVNYPLRYIENKFFLDSMNRVSRIERDKLSIYAVHFEYSE